MKMITRFILTLLICATFSGYGQTIKRKRAIQIAKEDTVTQIEKIKSVVLITNTVTHNLCWVVKEKINLKREQKKFLKSKQMGMHFIYTYKLIIDANTGEIILREKNELGSVHKTPIF